VARSYYDERRRIMEDAPRLRELIAMVGGDNDLGPPQWAQWYAVGLAFCPDLILELGRGRGNSTALFAQVASRLDRTRVVSLCQTSDWNATANILKPFVGDAWLGRVDARVADIVHADYRAIVGAARRVLVLWDAHGFEIADAVLGHLLPVLAERDHFVLVHDISDNRYGSADRSYAGQPLWKGIAWQRASGTWRSRVNIGWMNSVQDQVIALADFAARNTLEIGSADHEFAQFFNADRSRAIEMEQVLGDLFSSIGHWAFLSLTGKAGPFWFPAPPPREFSSRCAIVADDLPKSLVTTDQPWRYAASAAWRPEQMPPAGAQPRVEWRLRVEGGPIGVSLQTADEIAFVDTQVVAPSAETVTVRLRVWDLARRGRLVVHTWDAPVGARVWIDELSLVW
jgi:hypothetical protein